MGLSRAFIDGVLRHRVYDLIYHNVKNWPTPGTNKFNYHDWNYGIDWDIVHEGVRFYPGGNKGTKVTLKNIRISKLDNIVYGHTQRTNERSDDGNVKSFYNRSSNPIQRTYTLTKGTEHTTVDAETIGVDVFVGLSATIGNAAGQGGGVESSVTVTTEVTTSWQQYVENSSTDSKETEDSFTVTVKPNTRMEVTALTNKADVIQPMTVTGNIDFGIEIECPDQFHMEFDSIGNFETFIQGMLPSGTHRDYHGRIEQHVKQNPSDFKINRDGLHTTYSKEIKYQGAAAGDVIVKEFEL